MSKTLIIVLVVVALIALVGGGLAWAKHRGYCRHGGLGYVQERLSEKLALDAAQQEKLQTLGGCGNAGDIPDNKERSYKTVETLSPRQHYKQEQASKFGRVLR